MEINIKNNSTFTFNTTGSLDSAGYRFFMDNDNKIILPKNPEYGFYNKIINIKFSKLFYIKKINIGLGDIIDFFTRKLYIKDLIVYLTDGNCGCEARRIKFNKWFKIPFIKFGFRTLYAKDLMEIQSKKNKKVSKENKLNPSTFIDKNTNKIISEKDVIIGDSNASSDIAYVNYVKENKKNIETTNPTPNVTRNPPVNPSRISGGCGCRNKK